VVSDIHCEYCKTTYNVGELLRARTTTLMKEIRQIDRLMASFIVITFEIGLSAGKESKKRYGQFYDSPSETARLSVSNEDSNRIRGGLRYSPTHSENYGICRFLLANSLKMVRWPILISKRIRPFILFFNNVFTS